MGACISSAFPANTGRVSSVASPMTTGVPFLMIPAFSPAISANVFPKNCVWSRLMLEYAIKEENIRHGFARVNELTGLMGRWQKLSDHPLLICDTGHNTGGITYITQQIKSIVYDHLHIVIGMVNDKDIRGVLNLLPQDAMYYFTKASVKRALPEEELKRTAREFSLQAAIFTGFI